ncbi:hypothetical protein GS454_04660 [Rhodococcus hoagii]|nr:hypothetical protein [Prescottella equi]
MNTIFDSTFSGMPGAEMYRAWTIPDLFPEQPQPVLSNWDPADLEMYCGGIYAKAAA